MYFKGSPLYPFGHGLSYTTFAYKNLKLSQPSIAATGKVEISFDVENTGKLAGSDVAQLYTHQVKSVAVQPLQSLRDFERVTLQPGETKHVSFTLAASKLAWYHTAEKRFAVSRASST